LMHGNIEIVERESELNRIPFVKVSAHRKVPRHPNDDE